MTTDTETGNRRALPGTLPQLHPVGLLRGRRLLTDEVVA